MRWEADNEGGFHMVSRVIHFYRIIHLGSRIFDALGRRLTAGANRAWISFKKIAQLSLLRTPFFGRKGEDRKKVDSATHVTPKPGVTIFKLSALFLDLVK
jgi:hypothetical protein